MIIPACVIIIKMRRKTPIFRYGDIRRVVGRDTSEPKRSGTSRKTSNGNGGRTENPPALAVGSVKAWTANLPLWASVTTTVLAGLTAIARLFQDGDDE